MSTSSSDSSDSEASSQASGSKITNNRKTLAERNSLTEAGLNENDASFSKEDASDADEENAQDENVKEEAPVLSHAAQRRAKKKAEKAARSGNVEKDTISVNKLKEGKEKEQVGETKKIVPRDAYPTVWIGNLSFKTEGWELRRWVEARCGGNMEEDGEDENENPEEKEKVVASLRIPKGVNGANKGFAHVSFKTSEAHAMCLKLSESSFQGRKLLIKDAENFEGRPDKKKESDRVGIKTGREGSERKHVVKETQNNPPSATLFVGNLGFETKAEELKTMFDVHANPVDSARQTSDSNPGPAGIRNVRMMTFEDTGKCKGFAFVDFHSTLFASRALENEKNWTLAGRRLKLQYAGEDAVRRGNLSAGRKRSHDQDRDQSGSGRRGGDGDGDQRAFKKQKFERETDRQQRSNDSQNPIEDERKGRQNEDGNEKVGFKSRKDDDRKNNIGMRKKSKPKPGASLALAKRESYAIVESQGKKVVFD